MTTILGPDEGRVFTIGGDRVTVKGVADALGVGFALIDYRAAPGVPGPPLHRHDDIDEAWYLLEGSSTSPWATSAAASARAASCWSRTGSRTPSPTRVSPGRGGSGSSRPGLLR